MKTILISGASGGLGLQLCKVYLALGYRVFGTDLRENESTTALRETSGGNFGFFAADVTKTEDIAALHAWIAAQTPALDIILNAVGILLNGSEKTLEDFDIDMSVLTFNVNALGPLRIIKACLDLMRAGQEKMIVNISSEAGSITTHAGYINRYDYCMSKTSLNMESVILRRYLRPEGFRVLLVHPGWMKTTMGGQAAPLSPAKVAQSIASLVEEHKTRDDEHIYFDYNGTPRPW